MATKTKRTRDTGDLVERIGDKIVLASELEEPPVFLIYGRSGQMKTRTACTAPKPLLIDVNEKGSRSTRRDLNPHVIRVTHWNELSDIYWFLESGEHDFKTWILDGVTSMANLAMKFVLGDEASRDASRDPDMPTRPAWGKLGELMKTQILNYRNLPMYGVFTALERARIVGDEGDLEGELVIGPSVSPAVGQALEQNVSHIGHISKREVRVKVKGTGEIRKVVRTELLIGGTSERYATKDRDGVLDDVVINPNLTDMIRQLEGE